MTSSTPDVGSLFNNAAADGTVSPAALQALSVVDMGAQIQAGLGVTADEVTATEVVLVSILVDDSGSISGANNDQAVRDGHNLVLDALRQSKASDSVLVHTRLLNGEVINPYRPLDEAVDLDSQNYNPRLGTPLYDQTAVFWGTVLAKTQEFSDNGVPVRSISLVMSDGHDQHSHQIRRPEGVAPIAKDMLAAESHILAAMGVDDGYADFRDVFTRMGIRDQWILTPGNSPSEIRQAFQVFSQSAIRASQNAGSFSKTALGGFGNP